jgi:hypothetical protein
MKNPLPMLFLIVFVLFFFFYYAFDKEKQEIRFDPTLERTNYVAKCTQWIVGSGCKEFEIYKSKDFKD